MKRTGTYIITLLFLSTSLQAGGPWPQPKGQGYFKLSEWWLRFDEHYTDAGALDPNITTGIYNTFLYGEYGLTDRLTAIVNANIFSRNTINNQVSRATGEVLIEGEALNSIGDIDVSLKYGLTNPNAKFPVSATLTLGLPTGAVGEGQFGTLQTGDGEFNQILRVDVGHGFNISDGVTGYLSTYVGFNNRTNNFSDELRYGLEFGSGFMNRRLWLVGRLFGAESMRNGALSASVNSTSIFANNAEFTSASLEANYYITEHFGVSVSGSGAFRGQIIAAGTAYSAGVFIDL